jgi:hypothetical protein
VAGPLEQLIQTLYQREVEQLDEIQRAFLTGGGLMNLTADQAALLAIKLAMINQKMVARLAAEIDALAAGDDVDSS